MPTKTNSKTPADEPDDAGQAEVQERMDEIQEKGYLGTVPDETPNEDYTLRGVGKKQK